MNAARPVTGAFLLVAFADGHYDSSEERRFLSTLANHPALACVKTSALEEAYNSLIVEIEADFANAADSIMKSISAAKDDATACAAIKIAARGAVVADDRIAPQEEIMLSRIAEALGLEAGEV